MPDNASLEVATYILIALAAGAMFTTFCTSWIARAWVRRWLKPAITAQALQVRRAELLFEREYEAASAFSALLRQYLPTYHHPARSWHDACDSIACDFANLDNALNQYLTRHTAALPEGAHKLIGEAIGLTREHRFKMSEPEVPASANKAASIVYDKLWKAENELLARVRGS